MGEHGSNEFDFRDVMLPVKDGGMIDLSRGETQPIAGVMVTFVSSRRGTIRLKVEPISLTTVSQKG